MADIDIDEGIDPETELGNTGLEVWSGEIREEILRDLQGRKGQKAYREMSENDAVIGAVLFAIKMLIRSVAWSVQPGAASPEAEQAAEFLRQCVEDMDHTWQQFIDEILSKLVFGYSIHETVYKRRLGMDVPEGKAKSKHDDGRIGWKRLPIRAQETVDRWQMSDAGDLEGVWQQSPPNFEQVFIPIGKLLHFRPSAHKDNPEGRSVLRSAYRAWFFRKTIENMEGIGIERDLVGLPIAWVPGKILKPDATAADKAALESIKKLVTQVKRNEQEGVVMPLEYDDKGNKRFDFNLLSVQSRRQFDTGSTIERKSREMAMTVMADFILLGHEKVGSFALSDSKTSLFGLALGAWLDQIAEELNRQAVPRLFALNPEFDGVELPLFVHDDVETPDLNALGSYITALSGAGASLFPDRELENSLRRAAGLPELPEVEEGDDDEASETARRAFFAYQLQAGMVTINEARRREGLDPIDGGDVTLPQWRAEHPDWTWTDEAAAGIAPVTASVRGAVRKSFLPGIPRRGALPINMTAQAA